MLVLTSTRPGSTFEAMAEMSDGAPAPVEEFPDDPDPNGEDPLPDDPDPNGDDPLPDDPDPNGDDPLPDDPDPDGDPELGPAIAFVADPGDHTRWPTPAPTRMAAAAIEATATIGRCRRFAGTGCGGGPVKPGGGQPPGEGVAPGTPPPHPPPGGTPWGPPGPQPGQGGVAQVPAGGVGGPPATDAYRPVGSWPAAPGPAVG